MKIYYLIADGGDGSASVRFYDNKERPQELVDGDDYETYGCNDGCVGSFEVTGEVIGIDFDGADGE